MQVNRETSVDYQAHGEYEEQQAVLLGGHYGQPNRYLVGHVAEMRGKWPMAAYYF